LPVVRQRPVSHGRLPKKKAGPRARPDRLLLLDNAALAVTAHALEMDAAVNQREQRVVAADADALTRMDVGAALANQNVAGQNVLTVAALDAETLGLRVTAVLGRTYAFFVCHCVIPLLAVDRGDFHLGVGLTMALANHAALLGTIGQDVELLALAVFDNLGDNRSAVHDGRANLDGALLAHGQDLVKGDFGIGFGVQLLDEDGIADLDAVLLATGLDNCVHNAILFQSVSLVSGRRSAHFESPYHAA